MASEPFAFIIVAVKRLSHIRYVRLYPLAIPLRRPFEHATKKRAVADPVVIEVELADGTVGYGETLPRPYVSGETVASVLETIRTWALSELLGFRPAHFPEALEKVDGLPAEDEQGKVATAARAGLELALLDAYSRHFGKSISEAVGWLGLPGLGLPGSRHHVRYSGVLSGGTLRKLKRSTRMMRWYGLRDFKLKVGYEDDVDRVRTVAQVLGRSLGSKTTLRLDANRAWSRQQAIDTVSVLGDIRIVWIEQPFAASSDDDLVAYKQFVDIDVCHDESLVTMADAERLLRMGVADSFNIRISKNGGFLSALRLAHFARKNGIQYQLGCMVGETSILSAVGQRFIENVSGITFAEGSYGRFLLADDVVNRPVQFGYGGKIKPLSGLGWGIAVQPAKLETYVTAGVLEVPL